MTRAETTALQRALVAFVQPVDPNDHGGVGATWLHGDAPDSGDAHRAAVAACVAVVRDDPRWRLSLQTHKLIGLP